jgi:hypothetical protein
MGIFDRGVSRKARDNIRSINRVPRKFLSADEYEELIRRAKRGEDVYAYKSGQGSNWNVWVEGKRVWLNSPDGGDAA